MLFQIKPVFLHTLILIHGSARAVQVMVTEGKEPPCFLQLFQGGLIIHKGSRDDSANNTGDEKDADSY